MLLMVPFYMNFVEEFNGKSELLIIAAFMYYYFRVATIYSLAFSPDSNFLATSSNTGTVHIFRLNKLAQRFDRKKRIYS